MGKWKGLPHEEIPRCGAKTRPGHPCGHYAMANGKCRYHGGKSTGARNPYRNVKHGLYTKEAGEMRRAVAELLKSSNSLLAEIK